MSGQERKTHAIPDLDVLNQESIEPVLRTIYWLNMMVAVSKASRMLGIVDPEDEAALDQDVSEVMSLIDRLRDLLIAACDISAVESLVILNRVAAEYDSKP